jgi:hypothetical protein
MRTRIWIHTCHAQGNNWKFYSLRSTQNQEKTAQVIATTVIGQLVLIHGADEVEEDPSQSDEVF